MISMFETRRMLSALEQIPPARTFLRDTFFTNVRNFDTKYVDVDIYKGKRRVAAYVSPIEEGRVVKRDGFTTDTYEAPYIKEKRPTTAADVLTRQPGEIVYPGSVTPADRAAAILAKDMLELDDMITRAEEVQAAQGLFTGTVITRNNQEIDFHLSNTHKIVLAGDDLWSSANSKPLVKLRDWRTMLIKDSGVNPDIVIMSEDTATSFRENPTVQKEMNMLKVNNGQINPQLLPNGVTYIGYIADIGCDFYTYNEWYVDNADGLEKAMVPAKTAWMGSTRARMDRCYGVIQDLRALFAVARFPKSWETEDPSCRWLMLQAAPLLVPVQVDSFLVAQVLA